MPVAEHADGIRMGLKCLQSVRRQILRHLGWPALTESDKLQPAFIRQCAEGSQQAGKILVPA